MPGHSFNRQELRSAFGRIGKLNVEWNQIKSLNESSIERLVKSKKPKDPWKTRKSFENLKKQVTLLSNYKNFLSENVRTEKKSIAKIANELGVKDSVISRHLKFFGIKPVSKNEAISQSLRTREKEEELHIPLSASIKRVRPSKAEQEKRRAHFHKILESIKEKKHK